MPAPMYQAPKRPRMMTDREAKQLAMDKASRGPTNMALPPIPGNKTGMLIPGHTPGSSIWVPGSEDGAGPSGPVAPMWTPPTRPMGGPSLTARASESDGAIRTGPLSERGATPVGSGGMTPERRMKMFARRAWTRGDEASGVDLAKTMAGMDQRQQMQTQGMDFAREQADAQFQQGLFMNDLHTRSQAARDQQQRQDRIEMWNADKAAQEARDANQWNQQLTMFGLKQGADAMEAERQRKAQEAERGRVPTVGTIQVPGTDYVMPHADGRVMGTLPTTRKEAPLPAGMVPVQAERGGVQYGMPGTPKPTVPTVKEFKNAAGISEYRQWNHEKGGWEKVKFIDENGDGIDDRQQTPQPKPAASTSGGGRFGNEISRLMGGVK